MLVMILPLSHDDDREAVTMIKATLVQLPRLLRHSFLPTADGPYPRLSLQRILVMALFWPLFLSYLTITALCLALDHLLFPNYRRITITQPLFVIGVPRSGTTFLHRLLAADEQRFTTMSLQELLFAPSITQRMFWRGVAGLDRTVGSPLQRLLGWAENKVFAGLDAVHHTRLNDPEEDYLALIPVLQCFLLILPFGDPALMQLSRFDQVASPQQKRILIHFYRGLIQRHLYAHGRHKTFLSKNPSFTPMLQTLARGFPDARFIGCVRNPNQAVPSQVSSILMGARIFSGYTNNQWWRRELMQMLAYYYHHLLQTLPAEAAGGHTLVKMEQLATAPLNTIEHLYQHFDLTLSLDYGQWLRHEDEKAQRYRSGHVYRSQQLGISSQALKACYCSVYQALDYALPE